MCSQRNIRKVVPRWPSLLGSLPLGMEILVGSQTLHFGPSAEHCLCQGLSLVKLQGLLVRLWERIRSSKPSPSWGCLIAEAPSSGLGKWSMKWRRKGPIHFQRKARSLRNEKGRGEDHELRSSMVLGLSLTSLRSMTWGVHFNSLYLNVLLCKKRLKGYSGNEWDNLRKSLRMVLKMVSIFILRCLLCYCWVGEQKRDKGLTRG